MATFTVTGTTYYAAHPFSDNRKHIATAKYAEAVFNAVDAYGADSKQARMARREFKVLCNAQKRTMYSGITPKRALGVVDAANLRDDVCAKCASHIG